MRTHVIVFGLAVALGGCRGDTRSAEPAQGRQGAPPAGVPTQQASYKVEVLPPPPTTVGGKTKARVTLVPVTPYKINTEYPLKLTVTSPAGSRPARQVVGPKQAATFSEKRAVLDAGFELLSAGEHHFTAELRFSVCTKTMCELKHKQLAWVAEAK